MNANAPTILVTDANRGSAISIIRSLGRRGWPVIAADSKPSSLGFKSRFAAGHVVYPDPKKAPHPFVDFMVETVRNQQIDHIIPVTDEVLLPLSAQRARFEGLCKIAMPDATALDQACDKLRTIELARELGIPVPDTYPVSTAEEALQAAQKLSFPIVLKPQRSKVYFGDQQPMRALKVSFAEDEAALVQRMKGYEGTGCVLLQNYHKGIGYGVELLMCHGQPIAAFQHKRLREFPLSGGPSSFRESVPLSKDLYDYSVKLLAALRWTGLAMVEFKVGPAGPVLMEINGRVWGSLPLSVHSGMDFPWHLMKLDPDRCTSASPTPNMKYRVGVRSRNLEKDILWMVAVLTRRQHYPFLEMPARREVVGAVLGLFNPFYKFDVQSWSDPMPGLAEIPAIVKRLFKKARRQFGEGD